MNRKIAQDKQNVKPPSSITGVESTKKGLEVKPDFLSFTFKGGNSLLVNEVCEFLDLPREDWIDLESGGHGYHKQLICGNIHIYYEGREDMGIFISMTGKGCREYEREIEGNWKDFIKAVLNQGGTFTRFDSAIDDFDGLLSLDEIRSYAKKIQVVSKFKSWAPDEKYSIATGECIKDAVLFGDKGKSLLHLYIYNKALERGIEGHWIRAELRLKKERAHQFLTKFAESGHLGLITKGVLLNYIKFVEPSNDTNKSRWSMATFWSNFLGAIEKVKISAGEVERTIEQVKDWAKTQWAASAALIVRDMKGDLSFFDDLILDGERRLKPRHLALLQT